MNYAEGKFCVWKWQMYCQDRAEEMHSGLGFLSSREDLTGRDEARCLLLPTHALLQFTPQWLRVPREEAAHCGHQKSREDVNLAPQSGPYRETRDGL